MLAAMQWLKTHLRNKLLAGILAAGPVVVIVLGALWLEEKTRPLAETFGIHFPGIGLLLAVVGVYLLGLIVTSLLGKFFLRMVDGVIRRVPGLNYLYLAWKDVAKPGDQRSMFDRVVLVPDLEGRGAAIAFCSGEPVPGDERTLCVFLPGSPNPITGRLVLVDRAACLPLTLSVQDAFKFLLSTGNYVPEGLGGLRNLPGLAPLPPVNPPAETRSS